VSAAIQRIAGPDDARVAEYRSISDPELVRRRGLFIAEGRLVVRRLIEDRRCRVRSLLLSDAALTSLGPVLARAALDAPIYVCAADRFLDITGYNIHRGCLALAERPREISAAELVAAARTIAILDNVANPDNVGSIFRNAAAFNVDGVLLSPGCCDPLYRKAIRTSMAATLRVHFARLDPWPDALAGIVKQRLAIVALTPNPSAEEIDDFVHREQPRRIALLVGSEGPGLSAEAERHADYRVRISIAPEVDSLNVAVAAGIAMHRIGSWWRSSC
jgi:tRNA G18 (ribose-2'-O)-methylase SpoU